MFSFQNARKLRNYLLKAKVYYLERTVGSFKCNKSSFQVFLNVNEPDTFTSFIAKQTYKTKSQI